MEARFHRVCPWDNPSLSLGQSRGRREAQKVYVKKMMCLFRSLQARLNISSKIVHYFGVQETVLLVNHALARGTPAIFVIFFVSRGSSSKALVLLVRMQIRHFRHFRQKPFFFLAGQKHGLPKAPFSGPRLL